ncbi:hypothetical protein KW801_02480 [Candidatus Saccharibacteria bacterium]|nr:hypothetical protein [Candidatus Saccharibacteria bacterium]
MSEKREVNVNYGGRQFKFVRLERVYEVQDGVDKMIKDGGDYILNLTGHNAGSWEAYQNNQKSFNTLEYQQEFKREHHYTPVPEEPAANSTVDEPSTERDRPARVASSRTTTGTGARQDRAEPRQPAGDREADPLELTPEQQAALDLLIKDGILDRIIEQKVAEATEELKKQLSQFEERVKKLEEEARSAPTVMGADAVSGIAQQRTDKPKYKPVIGAGAVYERDGGLHRNPPPTPPESETHWVSPSPVGPVATETVTTAETPTTRDIRRRFRRGWLAARWRQLRGIPPAVTEYYEIPDTGRRYYVSEAGERVYLDETRGSRADRAAAVGAAILGLAGIAYIAIEVEEIKHRLGKPSKTVIINNNTKKVEQAPRTSTTEEEENEGATTPEGESGSAGTQDRDEPLSGTGTYFENSNYGGDGLQLDTQGNMQVTKNADGTYSLSLANGRVVKLSWNRQGKLTRESVAAIKQEHYEIGQATTNFTDREGLQHQHAYSVIGDQDSQ